MSFGPHAIFIWASYGATAVAIAGLIVWLIVDGRAQETALSDLESRSERRRSRMPKDQARASEGQS